MTDSIYEQPRWIYLEEIHSMELDITEWAETMLGRNITDEENTALELIVFNHLDQFCTGYRNYN